MYDLTNEEKKATRDGFGAGLLELGEHNKQVMALAASVGDSTRAFQFKEKYPDRYVECGIAEQNMIGIAGGLALAGFIPYPSSFASFLPGRCYDQIRQTAAYSNLNIKLVSTHAGLTVGADGATHQMMEDIAMLRAIPNLKIIVPCDAHEAKRAVIDVSKFHGPTYIRLGREKTPVFTSDHTPFTIGKAVTLKQGKDVTIIACGLMVYYSLLAAEELETQGVSVQVINMHTIKPLDEDAVIKAANQTKAILTVEEHQIYGGLGGAVAEVLAQHTQTKLKIMGMQDQFGESGSAKDLLVKYKLTKDDIIHEVRSLL